MDWLAVTGALVGLGVGIPFVLSGVFSGVRSRFLQPPIERKRQRQLDEAQDNLLTAEASLEYYRLMVPMLRARVKRLEAAQDRAAKVRASKTVG